jgi:hypothetical protein
MVLAVHMQQTTLRNLLSVLTESVLQHSITRRVVLVASNCAHVRIADRHHSCVFLHYPSLEVNSFHLVSN